MKLIHIGCALATLVFFSVRGVWMVIESPMLEYKSVRIAPHIIDTCLLVTGLIMALSIYSAFYTQSWLMVKLLGVVLYILAGSIALRYGKTKGIRICALVVAWGIFAYIVMVARTRLPVPFI